MHPPALKVMVFFEINCNFSCERHEPPCLVLAGGGRGIFHESSLWQVLTAACPLLQVGSRHGRKVLGGKCSFILHIYLTKILYRFKQHQLGLKHNYWWFGRIGHKVCYKNGVGKWEAVLSEPQVIMGWKSYLLDHNLSKEWGSVSVSCMSGSPLCARVCREDGII